VFAPRCEEQFVERVDNGEDGAEYFGSFDGAPFVGDAVFLEQEITPKLREIPDMVCPEDTASTLCRLC